MADEQHFGLISQHIGRLLGLHFTEKQLEGMGRSVMRAALELKRDPQPGSLQRWLENSALPKAEMDALARHLSVGETYFFRESKGLELFANEIIPKFKEQDPNQEIRIWSAGCSSGEEPYTLAMLLKENMPDLHTRNVRILASDFNADALKKAKSGVYTPWSFRETSETQKSKYFTPVGKHFEIKEEIRDMVTFFQLNLAGSAYPSADNGTENLDVIFCRNVLMYFMPDMAIEVAKRFHQALKQDGWLITSQVELHEDYYAAFQKLRYKQGIFYRKSSKEAKPNLLFDSFAKQVRAAGTVEKKLVDIKRPKATNIRKLKDHEKTGKVPLRQALRKNAEKPTAPATGTPNAIKKAEKLFEEANYGVCSEFCITHLENKPFDKRMGELLVRSLANLGKHDAARHWCEQLISADGENTGYLNLFATILMEQGDWLMAEKTLIKTLYLDPDHAPGLFNMYSVLNALGKNKLAKKYYENLLSVIEHLDDHHEISGLEGMTAGVARTLVKK